MKLSSLLSFKEVLSLDSPYPPPPPPKTEIYQRPWLKSIESVPILNLRPGPVVILDWRPFLILLLLVCDDITIFDELWPSIIL